MSNQADRDELRENIARHLLENGPDFVCPWDEQDISTKEKYRRRATAAIKAMEATGGIALPVVSAARAAGYAAGQLAMRERAADQMGGYLATIIRNMEPIPEPPQSWHDLQQLTLG